MRPAFPGGPFPSDDALDGCLVALCCAAFGLLCVLAVVLA